nr:MAG TPA: hypothetical protein [Caudoviricetes sp.]
MSNVCITAVANATAAFLRDTLTRYYIRRKVTNRFKFIPIT